jgi:hypothetical protein
MRHAGFAVSVGAAVLFSTVAPLRAQVAGPEFRVNSYTPGNQDFPAVGAGRDGRFVVVWASDGQDGASRGVFAQRFDPSGAPAGAELQVNAYTTGNQSRPAVAVAPDGGFVVVWQSDGQDGGSYGVFGQLHDAQGQRLGGEFAVNTYTTGSQRLPSVASDGGGRFVVVWQGAGQADTYGIFGRRYDSTGTPQGQDFLVNAWTTNQQSSSAVAAAANGAFVVAWASNGQDGSDFGVVGRRFDSTGAAASGDFLVNTATLSIQNAPVVAMAPAGAFLVSWISFAQDGSDMGVFGQRYDAGGTRQGAEFRVNSYTTFTQVLGAASMDAGGTATVVWSSGSGQDGNGDGVFAQRYEGSGVALGGEFQVNSYTTYGQGDPAVAAAPNGNVVVVWRGFGPGDTWGVFGRVLGDAIFRDGFDAGALAEPAA